MKKLIDPHLRAPKKLACKAKAQRGLIKVVAAVEGQTWGIPPVIPCSMEQSMSGH